MTSQHSSEPFWIDEPDWLCAVEFLNDEDPEGRDLAADTIGYLLGYARLTNTRSLALIGDPSEMAYEILFSFSSPTEKKRFLDLIRSNDGLGNEYIALNYVFAKDRDFQDFLKTPEAKQISSTLRAGGVSVPEIAQRNSPRVTRYSLTYL